MFRQSYSRCFNRSSYKPNRLYWYSNLIIVEMMELVNCSFLPLLYYPLIRAALQEAVPQVNLSVGLRHLDGSGGG